MIPNAEKKIFANLNACATDAPIVVNFMCVPVIWKGSILHYQIEKISKKINGFITVYSLYLCDLF